MKGKGCNHCQRSGYRGRTGIHELMMVTPKIREMIFDAKSNADVRRIAITQGMKTLYIDGVEKAIKGITTLDEVFRVAKRTEQDSEIEILLV
jgi:type IV pilus assembly protein PilB